MSKFVSRLFYSNNRNVNEKKDIGMERGVFLSDVGPTRPAEDNTTDYDRIFRS